MAGDSSRPRAIRLVVGLALLATACGGSAGPDLTTSGTTEEPSPTAVVSPSTETSTIGDVLDRIDPEAGYEELVAQTTPLPLGGGDLVMCGDVPELESTVEGTLGGTQNVSGGTMGALINYWMERLDTFGGVFVDRAHGGAIVLTFTDDPEPHRQAVALLTNATFDVLQVEFTEIELRATQEQLTKLMGTEFGLFSIGSGTKRNRVELELVDPPGGALKALADLVPTAAVCVSVTVTPEPPSGPLKVIPEPGENDPLVSCSGLPPVPYSTLINPPSISTVDHPAIEALRAELGVGMVELGADARWGVIAIAEDRADFAGLSPDGFGTVTFERRGDRWILAGSSQGSSCDAVVALPEGLGQVAVRLDPDSLPEPADTVINLLVTEMACSSGRQMGDALLGPQIVETDTLVLVAFAVVPVSGTAACAGNAPSSVTIELSQPLGDRILLDGLSLPPQPLTDEPY